MENVYRPATMDDAEDLLRWKNQADTRRFAITTHKKIKMKDHLAWLKKTLKRGKMKIWIIRVNVQTVKERIDKNVGNVRIENNEIAIAIDTESQGMGLASMAIKDFTKPGMKAKIVEGNIASMRLFISCGYKPISYQDGYYIFQYKK